MLQTAINDLGRLKDISVVLAKHGFDQVAEKLTGGKGDLDAEAVRDLATAPRRFKQDAHIRVFLVEGLGNFLEGNRETPRVKDHEFPADTGSRDGHMRPSERRHGRKNRERPPR